MPVDEEVLGDLRDRMLRAEGNLKQAMSRGPIRERVRLAGKLEGVALARSYLDEIIT